VDYAVWPVPAPCLVLEISSYRFLKCNLKGLKTELSLVFVKSNCMGCDKKMIETKFLSQINWTVQGCSCKELSDITSCPDLFAAQYIAPLFVISMYHQVVVVTS
jgi:hypothetical protein